MCLAEKLGAPNGWYSDRRSRHYKNSRKYQLRDKERREEEGRSVICFVIKTTYHDFS